MLTPSGRSIPIPPTGGHLSETNELGIYRLLQTDDAGLETAFPFALHIPATESDVRYPGWGAEAEISGGGGLRYGREWTPWLIGLLLIAMLAEWWVYRRGY